MLVGACGDGMKIAAEACDDGNNINGDGCSSTCTIEVGWSCVLSVVFTSFSLCTENKDGIWRGGLQCDSAGLYGCTAAGVIPAGYYCKGVVGSPDICEEWCGDGTDSHNLPATRCDDNNNLPNDGCSPTCYVETGWTCATPLGGLSVCT
jgi:cysteine-rich repeat protein